MFAGGISAKTGVQSVTQLPDHNKKTPEEIAKWEALLDEGYGYKHVAEVCGVGHSTVRKYLPGRGWTHAQVIEHAALIRHSRVV